MKFLIDRCAGHRLAEWLGQQGHDVVESQGQGPDPGDRKILEQAKAEDRVLVTMDKDFGEFIFAEGAGHCGLVRLPDVPAERRIVLMERLLADYFQELSAGSVITLRGGRIRISRPLE